MDAEGRPLTTIPPHVYALLRIAYGALGIIGLVGVSDPAFWRVSGLVAPHGTLHRLALQSGVPDLTGAAIFWAALLSYAAMTAGVHARASTAAAYFFALVQPHWNMLPLSSAFQAHRVGLFCLLFADGGAVWSIDAWRRKKTPAPQPGWPLRLFRLQVALIYLWSGITKLLNASWRNGSALSYVLANEQFRRFPWTPPPSAAPLLAILTYATLAWELSFPVLVLNRRTRWLALISGVALHAGMMTMLELGPFSLVMLASYLAFLDPRRLARRFDTHTTVTCPRDPTAPSLPRRQSPDRTPA